MVSSETKKTCVVSEIYSPLLIPIKYSIVKLGFILFSVLKATCNLTLKIKKRKKVD
jgi:hypothetical protein